MGKVYQATDTTLNRQVAVKVLPESLASDAERVARFEREAKTLASLNHPNIAQIFAKGDCKVGIAFNRRVTNFWERTTAPRRESRSVPMRR